MKSVPSRKSFRPVTSRVEFVDLLVGVALADGHMGTRELSALKTLVPDALGLVLRPKHVTEAIERAAKQCQSRGVDDVVVSAGRVLKDKGDVGLGIRMAVDVACAMDGVCEAERRALMLGGVAGGMTREQIAELIEMGVQMNSWTADTQEMSRPEFIFDEVEPGSNSSQRET